MLIVGKDSEGICQLRLRAKGDHRRLRGVPVIHDVSISAAPGGEPMANLSPKLADSLLREHVRRVAGVGKAMLLVERLARVALEVADGTSVVVSGATRLEDRPGELLRRQDFEELFWGAGTLATEVAEK